MKLDTKEVTANDRTCLHKFTKFTKKNWRKNSEIADEKKWVKQWVSRWKVTIKRLVWEFNLHWKFMCTDKIIIRTKQNDLVPSFHSSLSFLNYWKTAKSITLKFLGFQFIFTVLWKVKQNCMGELFCTASLLEVSRKKHFYFYGF